jgi:Predicted cobalamin binding protein
MKEYQDFYELLEVENKQNAVTYALQLLESGKMDVQTLYTQILTPALNQMECRLSDKRICIWKEHVRTAIVRTIVECCYPYVVKEREHMALLQNKTAIILCPPEEYHDLGARMVADFFTLCGWNAIYVGSNTPYQDFYNAADFIRPDVIAISITNYYTLAVSKKIIKDLKELLQDTVKIVVGGYAVREHTKNFETLHADYFSDSYADIRKITEEAGGLL